MPREVIYALTSLSPAPANVHVIRGCIQSWQRAGLAVRAFNHPAEIPHLARLYDVEFVPVPDTTASVFGRHFIPIKVMTDWAAAQNAPVLLINSDIYLALSDWDMKRLRWLSDSGLCYFVRYNHQGDTRRAVREPYGLDGFLFHGRHVSGLPDSFLSMGQPFWDYWLPHEFAARGRPIYTPGFPAAYHRHHPMSWSWENWYRCALEFARFTNTLSTDHSFEACQAMSWRVRQGFDQSLVRLAQRPFGIREWVQRTFSHRGSKIFLEFGAHQGTDTAWLARIPDATIHAFEPDPRNYQSPPQNVILHRSAIAEHDGHGPLILSQSGWGQPWTYSSSIKRPKNHLQRYPVTFGEAVEVDYVALDSFHRQQGLGPIDFIWADIQGAEGDMIRGGAQALACTRYLYTEYSDDEVYENQVTLTDIASLLPHFRVLELWAEDVLLENQRFNP